jgi:hypothetical protein
LEKLIGRDEPADYEAYCGVVRQIHDQFEELKRMFSNKSHYPGFATNNPYRKENSSTVDKMEGVEPTYTNKVTKGKKSDKPREYWGTREELRQRRADGDYLRCSDNGHFADQCKLPRSKLKPKPTKLKSAKKAKAVTKVVKVSESDDSSESDSVSGKA